MGASRCTGLVALALLLLAPGAARLARAQEVGGALIKRGVHAGNLYLAGSHVDVRADVDGDVVAAGGRISVAQLVRGDVLAAGGAVSIAGEMRDDVRVAGGTVDLAAAVAGDAIAAGGSVTLAPETVIRGRVWLAGGEVDVRGRASGSLRAAGGTVRVGAEVRGDVDLAGATIEVLPSARIGGNLTYRSPRPATIHPDARIAGTVTHHPVEATRWARGMALAGWLAPLALVLSLTLAGVVLVLLFPGFTAGAVHTLRSRVWSSLGVGFAVSVATPVAAVLLAATGIGIPLGLAVAATYLVAALAGVLVAATFVGAVATGSLRAATQKRMVLSVVTGVLLLGVLMLLPVAGAVAMTLGLVWGLGGLTVHGHRLYTGTV